MLFSLLQAATVVQCSCGCTFTCRPGGHVLEKASRFPCRPGGHVLENPLGWDFFQLTWFSKWTQLQMCSRKMLEVKAGSMTVTTSAILCAVSLNKYGTSTIYLICHVALEKMLYLFFFFNLHSYKC